MIQEQREIIVLGAGGWIGNALVTELRRQQQPVRPVDRTGLTDWLKDNRPSGPVIYAIGLTADFRQYPHETVEAHVTLVSKVVKKKNLDRLVLLSSTRVYEGNEDTRETAHLSCLPSNPSDIYNLSKLLGEALVLQDQRKGFKVVRISNVVGTSQAPETFIGALLQEAKSKGRIEIRQSSESTKDYIALGDVVKFLPKIATNSQHRLYNLGGGNNTSHAEIARWLRKQGVDVGFAKCPERTTSYPKLSIERLVTEFGAPGHAFRQTMEELSLPR